MLEITRHAKILCWLLTSQQVVATRTLWEIGLKSGRSR